MLINIQCRNLDNESCSASKSPVCFPQATYAPVLYHFSNYPLQILPILRRTLYSYWHIIIYYNYNIMLCYRCCYRCCYFALRTVLLCYSHISVHVCYLIQKWMECDLCGYHDWIIPAWIVAKYLNVFNEHYIAALVFVVNGAYMLHVHSMLQLACALDDCFL